jgi:hypothetical protein
MRAISYNTSATPPPRLRIDRRIIEFEQRSEGLVASDATLTLDSHHGLDGKLPPGVESTRHWPHVEFPAPVDEAKGLTEPSAKLRSAGRRRGVRHPGGVPGLFWLWQKE